MRTLIRGGVLGLAAAAGVGVAAAQMPVTNPGVNTPGSPAVSAPGSPPAQPAAATPAADPGVAATVNGEVIRLDQVDAFIKAKLAPTPLTTQQIRQLRTEVATEMADDVLLRQFLRKYGPKVEPAEIDRHVQAFTASLARQGKSFAGFLRETDQTEAQVRETWVTMIQLSRYVRERVSDDQLKLYHAANKDYFDRVEVRAGHIVIRVGPTAAPAEKAAAREKLRTLRGALLAGELDFAKAAAKHSQCPSATQGGDLGYILRKGMLMDDAFCKAAFALKPGELSDVVETEFGLHLIRVTDRKPGTPSTFEKCIEDVREAFTEDFRTELVAKLRAQAQIRITVP